MDPVPVESHRPARLHTIARPRLEGLWPWLAVAVWREPCEPRGSARNSREPIPRPLLTRLFRAQGKVR